MGATVGMVGVLFGTAWLMPAPSGTSLAQASFPASGGAEQPATVDGSGYGFGRSVASDVSLVSLFAGQNGEFDSQFDDALELASMQTASGPEDGGLDGDGLDYDLHAVIQGDVGVPRLNLASLPDDLQSIRETAERKAVFFKSVLPLVLQVNEQIVEDRARLWDLRTQKQVGSKLNALDRLWLAGLAERYGVDRDNIGSLLRHHDVVPPSLALAQAATESAWGTSRFVREGNAIFGEWTFAADHKGIVPNQRDEDKSHRVRAFDSLLDSVQSYVDNLNKHRAYKEFRAARADMRTKGQIIDGMRLANTLYRYSERGADYVSELHAIIGGNELDMLDGARLSRDGTFEPLI